MDAAQKALETYTVRVGQVYFDPNYVIDAPKAEAAGYYYTRNIPFKTCAIVQYNAPDYGWKNNMLYPTKNPQYNSYGAANGQAPTQGVFTGIPSGCNSSNGMYGSH